MTIFPTPVGDNPMPDWLIFDFEASSLNEDSYPIEFGWSDLMYRDDGPDLWLFGHGHQTHDFTVGNCRLMSNPRGYSDKKKGFENADWDPKAVIDTNLLPRFRPSGPTL